MLIKFTQVNLGETFKYCGFSYTKPKNYTDNGPLSGIVMSEGGFLTKFDGTETVEVLRLVNFGDLKPFDKFMKNGHTYKKCNAYSETNGLINFNDDTKVELIQ